MLFELGMKQLVILKYFEATIIIGDQFEHFDPLLACY